MSLIKLLIFLFICALSSSLSYAGEEYNADIRFLHVQKGQTLHNIVKRIYPERRKEWSRLTADIVRLNPHAFVDNDPTKMKAEVRLTLPNIIVIDPVSAKPLVKFQVGVVQERSGSVIAVDKRKVSRKLHKNSPIFIGDKVITGEDGSVRLQMIDDAVLDLRCFSIMVIEEYALKAGNRRSILNLLQGSLKKITGKIGDLTEDVYELRTPIASVGVRGTEYALRVFQSKGCGGTVDADESFYLEVIKGLVDVRTKAGQQVYAKGDTAYVDLPESMPKKVKIKPGIIKPAPVPAPVDESTEGTSLWWWLLGIVALVLII
jgi:hypothetical protein